MFSKKNRVLVLMSGGVDSSVTALLLKKRGFDVTGVTMVLFNDDNSKIIENKNVNDAKLVAKILNINHVTLDLRKKFKENVIDYFVDEYLNGRTPNPCVMCNKCIKFGVMFSFAKENGFNYIASGHYAHIFYSKDVEDWILEKSPTKKDQSYVLYNLKQEDLKHILLPLWNMEKSDVRNIAKEYNLPVAQKKGSQEICFIKDNDYTSFIKRRCSKIKTGNFIDIKGNVLGKHEGIINYTIGQRKGLGITFGKPMYVTNINNLDYTVTLGGKSELSSNGLIAKNVNVISEKLLPLGKYIDVSVKLRYKSSEIDSTLIIKKSNSNKREITCKVTFKEPTFCSVTAGQSVVFYKNNIVLGGGIICSRF